ncbi:hypothetical protein [Dehalobacterium formicoaceticum]|uniref:ABC transporter permease n=1 Tax=Dehalobacterium formicoaceticum TaxID=51515 RepID=A0ABT1Y466_9FIRM|nr:hypothetical protein [Dehalobacterium formicoaceticum]MCR6545673.1 hypothetical protein [Dehalobacterium formicoaceticum]
MSLTETDFITLIKNQFIYKLKAHIGLLNRLAVAQLVILLLTFGRTGMSGSGGDSIDFEIQRYANYLFLIISMMGVTIIGVMLSNETFRNTDFTFVSNRLSSNLSNIVFLLTVSVVAGMTASLYGVVIRLLLYFTQGSENIIGENFFLAPKELLLGIFGAILYMILFSAIGYFLGTLTKSSRSRFLLPVLVTLFLVTLVSLFIMIPNGSQTTIFSALYQFFAHEKNLFIFMVKILVIGGLLFLGSILVSNRREVRQ